MVGGWEQFYEAKARQFYVNNLGAGLADARVSIRVNN